MCGHIWINPREFRVFHAAIVKTCQSRLMPCEPQPKHNILHADYSSLLFCVAPTDTAVNH